MKKLFLYILLIYCNIVCSAGNSTLVNSKFDISDTLAQIELVKYSNTEQAKKLALETLNVTLSNDDIRQQIQLYEILGELEIELANYQAAITYYSTALSLSEELNQPGLILDMLNLLTITFQQNGQSAKAIEAVDRAIELSMDKKFPLKMGIALQNKGRIFHIQGEYDSAFQYFSKANDIYHSLDNKKMLAKLLDDQGNTAMVKGSYQEATQYFFRAINIHKDIDNKDGKAEINLDLGIVYSAMGELKLAEKYFLEAIVVNPIGRESVLRNARVYFNLADLFSLSGDFDSAILYSKKSIEAASLYDDQRILTFAYLNLAEASIPVGNYAEARLAVNKCLEYTQKNNTPRLEIYSHLLDSRISIKYGELIEAETALLKSMTLAKKINAEESLLLVMKELSELYATLGDLAKAYKYLVQYDQLKDQIFNEESKRILFQEQEKHNSIEQQKTIIKLENEKLVASLQASKDKVRSFIFVSCILLLLITLVFLFLRYRHNLKTAEVINKTNNELKQAYIEIENIALTDSLTLLKNRRAIVKNIQDHYLQFKRHKRDFCVILIDIDFFKQFNDTYGHHCGDVVLKEVAQCIKATARESDEVARWGGEEFLVFLPDTSLENGKLAAERTRQAVEALNIDYVQPDNTGSQKLKLTITLGVTNIWNDDTSSDSIIVRADKALYQGKKQGRNCIVSL
jgi:diguanylate cyclase (GGDEF)-like protein